jgi:hypothetical protein
MGVCSWCGSSSTYILKTLRVCLNCIRDHPEKTLRLTDPAHKMARAALCLPDKPPGDPKGIPDSLCVNESRNPDGGRKYCGSERTMLDTNSIEIHEQRAR